MAQQQLRIRWFRSPERSRMSLSVPKSGMVMILALAGMATLRSQVTPRRCAAGRRERRNEPW